MNAREVSELLGLSLALCAVALWARAYVRVRNG